MVRRELERRGVTSIRVVLSHHHKDHVAGTEVFADCEIIAGAKCARALRENHEAFAKSSPPIAPVVMRHRCMQVSDWLWRALLRLALLVAQQPYSASPTDLVRKGRSRLVRFWVGLSHLIPSNPSKRNSVFSIHIRCSRTASLRATATTARRRPFVRINRMPHDFNCDAAIVRINIAFAAEYPKYVDQVCP